MKGIILNVLLLSALLFCTFNSFAQKSNNKGFHHFTTQMKLLFKKDSSFSSLDELWADAFAFSKFKGKIIRNIQPVQLNFDLGFENSENLIIEAGTQVLDKLHTKTKSAVILKNLYIAENQPLDPYLLADNERFLRTIPYIQDARIKVTETDNTDSVDIIIYTKDIFGFSGMLGGLGMERQKFGLSTINLAGTGQEVGVNFLNDIERTPHKGFEGFYRIQNIKGTFIDVSLSAGTISENLYNHKEDEWSAIMELSLPLVSQFKKWTGGLIIGQRTSKNLYPDSYSSGIYKYRSGIFDLWGGYNLNVGKKPENNKLKLKKLIALRYVNHIFFEKKHTIQVQNPDERLISNQGILAGLTLFKQYYYKTNYIYEFGTTEDIPAGYNLSAILGYYQHHNVNRPYLGLNLYNYTLSSTGDMAGLFLRTGFFYHQQKAEDVSFLTGASLFTRQMHLKRALIRNYFRLSYATVINRKWLEPLRINNSFGLYGFDSDLAQGAQRISIRSESFFFLPKKIIGFNIAPISIIDIAWLNHYTIPFNTAGFFLSIGAGVRVKNENLGLNTFEVRISFLPRRLIGDEYFNFSISTDLNFKFRGNYVNKPELIELNSDHHNHIF